MQILVACGGRLLCNHSGYCDHDHSRLSRIKWTKRGLDFTGAHIIFSTCFHPC